jgi:hypothetical protein
MTFNATPSKIQNSKSKDINKVYREDLEVEWSPSTPNN